MATKPDAAKPAAAEPDKKPVKSKKRLLIGMLVFLVLAVAGAGAWFVLNQRSALDEGEELVGRSEPKAPPTFFPLENMVVNLADPGGDKVAQIGITLELADSKTVDKVKLYLPSIRSGILLLISQRTAGELLQLAGKEKLATDILLEASRPFADTASVSKNSPQDAGSIKKMSAASVDDDRPIRKVHFSSFIVQ